MNLQHHGLERGSYEVVRFHSSCDLEMRCSEWLHVGAALLAACAVLFCWTLVPLFSLGRSESFFRLELYLVFGAEKLKGLLLLISLLFDNLMMCKIGSKVVYNQEQLIGISKAEIITRLKPEISEELRRRKRRCRAEAKRDRE